MNYQFIAQLPKHLETAYRAGNILVESGVARDLTKPKQPIIAHLELASNLGKLGKSTAMAASAGNPAIIASGFAMNITKLGLSIDNSIQLRRLAVMIQTLQVLSCVNIVLTGAVLGVCIVGFRNVNARLNYLDKKLNILSSQVTDLKDDAIDNLFYRTKSQIKNSSSWLLHLEQEGLTELIKVEIEKCLNEMEVNLDSLMYRLISKKSVSLSVNTVQTLATAYANLIKVYLTYQYTSKKELSIERLEILSQVKEALISSEMMDAFYEQCLFSENGLPESDLTMILKAYKQSCTCNHRLVSNHYEILESTPIDKFKEWNILAKSSEDPMLWIEH